MQRWSSALGHTSKVSPYSDHVTVGWRKHEGKERKDLEETMKRRARLCEGSRG